MDIRIKATKLELTPAIRDYAESKIGKLEKYLGSKVKVTNCDLEIEKTTDRQRKGEIFRVEVNLEVPREILRVEKTEKDLYKAIDKVQDHLEQVISKYKEKLIDKARGK